MPNRAAGFTPNVMRNAIVNVAETVCYDITKDTLLYYNVLQNGIPLHFSAAAAAGQSLVTISGVSLVLLLTSRTSTSITPSVSVRGIVCALFSILITS